MSLSFSLSFSFAFQSLFSCLFQSPDIFDLLSTRNAVYWLHAQRSKHFITPQKKLGMWQVKCQKRLQKAWGVPAPRGNHPACILRFTSQLRRNRELSHPGTRPGSRRKELQAPRQDTEGLGLMGGGPAVDTTHLNSSSAVTRCSHLRESKSNVPPPGAAFM